MATNVNSVMYLTQLAIPHLEASKGSIVNISSIAGGASLIIFAHILESYFDGLDHGLLIQRLVWVVHNADCISNRALTHVST